MGREERRIKMGPSFFLPLFRGKVGQVDEQSAEVGHPQQVGGKREKMRPAVGRDTTYTIQPLSTFFFLVSNDDSQFGCTYLLQYINVRNWV